MIMPRYGLGYWWHYPWHYEGDRFDENDHFVFVEEALQVALEGLLDPGGEPISRDVPLGKRPWRFRFSGIQVRTFLDIMGRIEPVDHDNVTDDQRQRRRIQLVEELGDASLPLFDLFADEENESLPFLRGSLSPGSWYWIGVRRLVENDDRLPIFVGAPELPPGPYLPGALQFLEAVPPYVEYRLRDIFSLIHVSDAGFEEAGGEVTPPPRKPRDPLDGMGWSKVAPELDSNPELPSQEFEA